MVRTCGNDIYVLKCSAVEAVRRDASWEMIYINIYEINSQFIHFSSRLTLTSVGNTGGSVSNARLAPAFKAASLSVTLVFYLLSLCVCTEAAGKLSAEAGGRRSAGYKLYFTPDGPGTAALDTRRSFRLIMNTLFRAVQ